MTLAQLIVLAQSNADENSTAFELGRVLGTVLVIALIVLGVKWLIDRFSS